MKYVKIKGTVITAQYGALGNGTILKNVSDEFAKHLVEDCNAAEYLTVEQEVKVEVKTETKTKTKAKKG